MTVAYLDTSAAINLVVEEAESAALMVALTGASRRLAASWLPHTEIHCAAGRNPAIISLDAITVLEDDAIHLATALRIGADEIVTDVRRTFTRS